MRQQRLVWTSVPFPAYRPAVFVDVQITAIVTTAPECAGTRYAFTAWHRGAEDLETNMASGFYQGTDIVVNEFAAGVVCIRQLGTDRLARERQPVRAKTSRVPARRTQDRFNPVQFIDPPL